MITVIAISITTKIVLSMLALVVGYLILFLLMIGLFYKKVSQGQALVRTGMGQVKVSLNGIYVLPLLHMAEYVDITLKKVPVSFSHREPLQFKGGEKAVFDASFFVRVCPTEMDIRRVAQSVAPATTFSQEKIAALFHDKFYEAVKHVAIQANLSEHLETQESLKMAIFDLIGEDLNGFVVDDMAIKNLAKIN